MPLSGASPDCFYTGHGDGETGRCRITLPVSLSPRPLSPRPRLRAQLARLLLASYRRPELLDTKERNCNKLGSTVSDVLLMI